MSNKPRNKKKTAPTPTRSFDQLVADNQIKRLEPLVRQIVAEDMRGATQAIYQFIMGERAALQTRQMAFERMLKVHTPWFSEDTLAIEVAKVEDESQGLVPSTEPVAIGDKVRVNVSVKEPGADGKFSEDYGEVIRFAIHEVGVKGVKGAGDEYQTNGSLEQAILGMVVGETKDFEMRENTGVETFTPCRVNVVMASRAPVTETQEVNFPTETTTLEVNQESTKIDPNDAGSYV